jgi:hypothetical protein
MMMMTALGLGAGQRQRLRMHEAQERQVQPWGVTEIDIVYQQLLWVLPYCLYWATALTIHLSFTRRIFHLLSSLLHNRDVCETA